MKQMPSWDIWIVGAFFWRAFVLWCLWSWFISSLSGLQLSYWQTVGITLTASVLTGRDVEKWWNRSPVNEFASMLLILSFCWFIK